MFQGKNLTKIALVSVGAIILSFVVTKMHDKNNKEDLEDDYKKIQTYLLNDSPLYGYNRPKMWIHSKYEINARNWKSFQSRNTTDLNQPYLHLTIKSILNYNSDDFNICLIDDNSFKRLIPSWDVDLQSMAEPMKTHFRELGMLMLVYYYGGMVVPNSFICLRKLLPFYEKYSNGDKFFATENVNKINDMQKYTENYEFVPDIFICGANKNNDTLMQIISQIQNKLKSGHFTSENDFKGYLSTTLLSQYKIGKITVVNGKEVGVKDNKNNQILLDDLMEEKLLNVGKYIYGVHIPSDELLKRTKYSWFAVMSEEELLNTRIALTKYLKVSTVDALDCQTLKSKTVVSI